VKVFRSIRHWGYHFIASDWPLETPSIEQVMARMPPSAVRDLLEWEPQRQARELWQDVLNQEVDINKLVPEWRFQLAVTDDRPFNEYFVLRRSLTRFSAFLENTRPFNGYFGLKRD